MGSKYEALRTALATESDTVTWSFAEIDRLVGGLPPSARQDAKWWGNTWAATRVQARSWLSASYRVDRVDLAAGTVRFVPGAPPRPDAAGADQSARRRRGAVLDGVEQLERVLRRAGYDTVVAAVAEHAVFLHPDTVHQTGGNAVFPTVRDMIRRGSFHETPKGRRVLLDDNTSPTLTFLWAAGRSKGPDVQYNHVWNDSANPDAYIALWNLCATPAFLAKTTDGSNHPDVVGALRYRAWTLYGCSPAGTVEPARPAGYDKLAWAPHPAPVLDLEETLRARLRTNFKSRPALAARTIGWLFSDWQPDPTI
jgi:hypothetical protein